MKTYSSAQDIVKNSLTNNNTTPITFTKFYSPTTKISGKMKYDPRLNYERISLSNIPSKQNPTSTYIYLNGKDQLYVNSVLVYYLYI